ncbi:hypothetical protein LEN26_002847 [Aphanomyces euteiches]|nr:hypothetical protein LEN26_002847 [Aphanomyces euteiches]KAH9182343.1 hypothetical protein AeNC1_015680 [Aphanomyces euteiches]
MAQLNLLVVLVLALLAFVTADINDISVDRKYIKVGEPHLDENGEMVQDQVEQITLREHKHDPNAPVKKAPARKQFFFTALALAAKGIAVGVKVAKGVALGAKIAKGAAVAAKAGKAAATASKVVAGAKKAGAVLGKAQKVVNSVQRGANAIRNGVNTARNVVHRLRGRKLSESKHKFIE